MIDKITKQYFLYRAGKLDPEAFAKVYDLCVDKIYRYIYFKVSSVQEAQDITSEVFLKTWEYLQEEERKLDNLEALLYRIARNLVIDFYRKREHDQTVDLETVSEKVLGDKKQTDYHDEIDIKIETKKVLQSLSEMNDLYREVIILKYVDQLSTKEIASIIKKSSGATRVLIHRAVEVLKEIMNRV